MSAAGTLADDLTAVSDTVSFLRSTIDPQGDEWLRCDRLVGDVDLLRTIVRSTAEGRGTRDEQVATSLFVQAYAYRVAAAAIGVWVLRDRAIDVRVGNVAVALSRHRPSSVGFDAGTPVTGGSAEAVLDDLLAALFAGHLDALVAAAHGVTAIGERLLWGNVAASCASAFGAFHGAVPEAARADVLARRDRFFDAAGERLDGLGHATDVGPAWYWNRTSCCLWYRTSSGFRCEDCSLHTPEERHAQFLGRAGGA
jgi:iron complex transport system ATP-binding protein